MFLFEGIYRWITGAVIALLILGGVYWAGKNSVQKLWDIEIAKSNAVTEALVEQRLKDNKELLAKQKVATKQAQEELYAANTKLDALYRTNHKLRINSAACSTATRETKDGNTKGTSGATTGVWELPQGTTDNLFRMTRRADELVESCRAMQKVCLIK